MRPNNARNKNFAYTELYECWRPECRAGVRLRNQGATARQTRQGGVIRRGSRGCIQKLGALTPWVYGKLRVIQPV